MSILTFLLAGIGAFGPYQQSLNGLPGESGASGSTIGYWYIYTYSSSSGNTKSDGTVVHCQNIINNKIDLFRLIYDVPTCKCIISAAALAVLAFLCALLASVTACVAGIRRFGAGLSVFGAICALVSFVIYVVAVDNKFQNISAGWPCEVAAFLFFVIQTILFVRVVKPL
jgi:hypothetical protein